MVAPLLYAAYVAGGAVAAWLLGEGCGSEDDKYKLVFNCKSPDPKKYHPDAKIEAWDPKHPEKSSIFACQGKGYVDHITCDSDGYNIVSDVTPCPDDYVCDSGKCIGPGDENIITGIPGEDNYLCVDSDPDNNPYETGHVDAVTDNIDETVYVDLDHCLDYEKLEQVGCKTPLIPKSAYDISNFEPYLSKTVSNCLSDEVCCWGRCQPQEQAFDYSKYPELEKALPLSCTDSDPNNNLFIKGHVVVTDESGNLFAEGYDSCNPNDPITIFQVECGEKINELNNKDVCIYPFADNHVWDEVFDYCPAGTACNDGKCTPDNNEFTCSDTDGGINIFVGGTVYLEYADEKYAFVDECYNQTLLIENSCEGNTPSDNFIVCPDGCDVELKACNLSEKGIKCYDDDTSNKPNIMGTVYLDDGTSVTDYCSNDYPPKVMQVDCDGNGGYIGKETECEENENCNAGVCE